MFRENAGLIFVIVISIFAAAVAIAAYQLIINKYYWGPKGPPVKKDSEKA